VPITWPLPAFKLKKNLPFLASLRSYRLSSGAFFLTDSIPLRQEVLAVYPSLAKMTSPLPAFRLNWNSPFFRVEITNFPMTLLIYNVNKYGLYQANLRN